MLNKIYTVFRNKHRFKNGKKSPKPVTNSEAC